MKVHTQRTLRKKNLNLKNLETGQRSNTASTMRHHAKWRSIEWDIYLVLFPIPKIQSSSLRDLRKKYIYKPKKSYLSVICKHFHCLWFGFKNLRLWKTNRWNIFRHTWPKVKESHKTLRCLLMSMDKIPV